MKMHRRTSKRTLWVSAAILALAVATPKLVGAQATPADTAAVLHRVAQQLRADGRNDLARRILQLITERYPGSPTALQAQRLFDQITSVRIARSGRAELIAWNTLYGAWLGVAVPAAFGADEPEPYGAGLLAGAPLGFIAARAYGLDNSMSAGQARAITFGSIWGTWQLWGWREVLDLGVATRRECFDTGFGTQECHEFQEDASEEGWTAIILGGLAGIGTGALIGRSHDISIGTATAASHGALWGTWFGFAGEVLFEVDDDDAALAWTLIGGDVGLIAGALVGQSSRMSAGRAWLISAAGFAGLVGGFGVDLLLDVDDDQAAVLIPILGSAAGLITGASITRNFDSDAGPALTRSVLELSDGKVALGLPLPEPTLLPRVTLDGSIKSQPGLKVNLLNASF